MDMHSADSLHYRLTRIGTEAATGYFDALPEGKWDFDSALAWCRSRPNDDFMRKQMLRLIAQLEPETVKQRILSCRRRGSLPQGALLRGLPALFPIGPVAEAFSNSIETPPGRAYADDFY